DAEFPLRTHVAPLQTRRNLHQVRQLIHSAEHRLTTHIQFSLPLPSSTPLTVHLNVCLVTARLQQLLGRSSQRKPSVIGTLISDERPTPTSSHPRWLPCLQRCPALLPRARSGTLRCPS